MLYDLMKRVKSRLRGEDIRLSMKRARKRRRQKPTQNAQERRMTRLAEYFMVDDFRMDIDPGPGPSSSHPSKRREHRRRRRGHHWQISSRSTKMTKGLRTLWIRVWPSSSRPSIPIMVRFQIYICLHRKHRVKRESLSLVFFFSSIGIILKKNFKKYFLKNIRIIFQVSEP